MALSDGDYFAVETGVVNALEADGEAGGLREGGSGPVATIKAGDASLLAGFGQADFPAILVRAVAKRESPPGPAYSVLKTFAIKAWVFDRAMDRAAVDESVRRLASRMELVLRSQTSTDRQFGGLPDRIDGAEGTLVCSVQETRFPEAEASSDWVVSGAETLAEISVPCSFRYE